MNGDQPIFPQSYLDYLGKSQLPPVEVYQDDETDDLAIETVGDWPVAMFWETVVMS
ncbi:MAG TPA: hypothetical protein VMQ52_00635 [Candidatus Saccharimonadales bacterium]|jgi:nicotinic acid phosphoribosyltransferase|nr:hypothetical protein [Candidatus Saccharimonadales bacterium]